MVKKYYQELVNAIEKAPRVDSKHFDVGHYVGTPHPMYNMKTATVNGLVRDWKKQHPDLTYSEMIKVVTQLYQGKTYNEKVLAPIIIASYPKLKAQLDITLYNQWLEHLSGWAEIDCSCQSMFTAEDMLKEWPIWQKQLTAFSKSDFIAKRRASLVLLCKPARTSFNSDPRIARQALENIARLQSEKDILITKAVSWLLRSMIKYYRPQVEEYLKSHEAELPRIAVRETRRKLLTGRK